MKNLIAKLGAVAAGALAMYYLDPQLGAQRRALLGELLASGLPGRGGRRDSGDGDEGDDGGADHGGVRYGARAS